MGKATPDWQLPDGVDRGLWDYLHSSEMAAGYDAEMRKAALATADIAFCEAAFDEPGRLIDLGCGTGRLCLYFAAKGFECVGADLSPVMLDAARGNAERAGVCVEWVQTNLVDLAGIPDASVRYAACLFSTLGMLRGADARQAAIRATFRVLEPGGAFVMHVHNRWYPGLGAKRIVREALKEFLGIPTAGDLTMPQAYGGAELTLHHFTRGEALRLLADCGFDVRRVAAVGHEQSTGPRLAATAYGYLFECRKRPR